TGQRVEPVAHRRAGAERRAQIFGEHLGRTGSEVAGLQTVQVEWLHQGPLISVVPGGAHGTTPRSRSSSSPRPDNTLSPPRSDQGAGSPRRSIRNLTRSFWVVTASPPAGSSCNHARSDSTSDRLYGWWSGYARNARTSAPRSASVRRKASGLPM